jgi:hypothetical protein
MDSDMAAHSRTSAPPIPKPATRHDTEPISFDSPFSKPNSQISKWAFPRMVCSQISHQSLPHFTTSLDYVSYINKSLIIIIIN